MDEALIATDPATAEHAATTAAGTERERRLAGELERRLDELGTAEGERDAALERSGELEDLLRAVIAERDGLVARIEHLEAELAVMAERLEREEAVRRRIEIDLRDRIAAAAGRGR